MSMKKLNNRTKILIGIFIYHIILTVGYTIIYIIKGGYPEMIYNLNIPIFLSEFFILFKLEVLKYKNEEGKENG